MQTKEFLEHVWPDSGYYCIVSKDEKNKVIPTFFNTIDEAVADAERIVKENKDAYFACSTFQENTKREQSNAKEEKALWLDIDCGYDKGKNKWKDYRTKEEAAVALRKFTDETKLPPPTLVDSGNGIHCYWTFTEPVIRAAWQPVAEGLKHLCVKHGFKADPSRTADAASILRIPLTKNFKDIENPKDVKVIHTGRTISFDEIASYIPVHLETKSKPKRVWSDAAKHLLGNYSYRFKKILDSAKDGKGCPQLTNIFVNQSKMEEPLWRSGLSIAGFCEDAEVAVHNMSKRHPGYTYEKTEAKLAGIPLPHTCKEFENKNPGGCDGCIHKGKINTPIMVGRVMLRARAADNIVEAVSEEFKEVMTYSIPELPAPYFRGKNGGIYKSIPDDEDNGIQIYEHDFYLVDRLNDSAMGEMCWFKLHLPKDGVREFIAPLSHLLTKDKAREIIVSSGVVAMGRKLDNLIEYISVVVADKQRNAGATEMYKQYGWNEAMNKILIGNREITAFDSKYVPVSDDLSQVNRTLHKKGTYEAWKKAISVYERPGMELRSFGFFCAFGSLLMPFLKEKSAVINFYHPESGQGKTTILQAMTSVFGNPDIDAKLIQLWGDTENSVINRLGFMKNLPSAVDEFTDVTATQLHAFLKFVASGRGRNRMSSGGTNKERDNNTIFNLICVVSSNTDFRSVILNKHAKASGEMARFIQIYIEMDNSLSKTEADEYFDALKDNYGHAGEVYAQYLIQNVATIEKDLKAFQVSLDKKLELSGRDRKYSATLAAVFFGAHIAQKLGIHNVPIKPVYDAISKELATNKVDLKERDFDAIETLGSFLRQNYRNTLVINSSIDARSGVQEAPIQKPFNELMVRFEPDSKAIYIACGTMTTYLGTIGIEYKDFIKDLKNKNILLPESGKSKILHKGLDVTGPGTRCIWIDATKFDGVLTGDSNA